MTLWSILMPRLSSRNSSRLRESILHHISGHPIEFIDLVDDSLSSGSKRHILTRQAKGEYISFVDDDDDLSPLYVPSILDSLVSKPDVVTFRLKFSKPGLLQFWDLSGSKDNRNKGIMAINHLCVWKKQLASQVSWCPSLGTADDVLWYEPLLKHIGRLHTLNHIHINNVLYNYLFYPMVTANQTSLSIQQARAYFGRGLRCFYHQNQIMIEHGAQKSQHILVRDADNNLHSVNKDYMTLFHKVVPWCVRDQA